MEVTIKRLGSEEVLFTGDTSDGSLDGLTFSHLNLRYADFSEQSIEDCVFEYCDLGGASFSKSLLNNVAIIYCNLTYANFTDSNAEDCSFDNSDLYNADFADAVVPIGEREVWSEILRQQAYVDQQTVLNSHGSTYKDANRALAKGLKVAGLVHFSHALCWNALMELEDPDTDWALSAILPYLTGRDIVPSVILRYVQSKSEDENFPYTTVGGEGASATQIVTKESLKQPDPEPEPEPEITLDTPIPLPDDVEERIQSILSQVERQNLLATIRVLRRLTEAMPNE